MVCAFPRWPIKIYNWQSSALLAGCCGAAAAGSDRRRGPALPLLPRWWGRLGVLAGLGCCQVWGAGRHDAHLAAGQGTPWPGTPSTPLQSPRGTHTAGCANHTAACGAGSEECCDVYNGWHTFTAGTEGKQRILSFGILYGRCWSIQLHKHSAKQKQATV